MMEINMMNGDSMEYTPERTAEPLVPLKQSVFQNISRYILLLLTFLLPVFFIPSTIFPFQFGKVLIISLGTMLAFISWAIHQLKTGGLKLPKTSILHIAALILITGLASSLLSSSFTESVFGTASETGTLLFTLILFLLLFVSSQVLDSSKSIITFYLTLFASSAILVVYHLLRIFLGADFLDFGILNSNTSSLLGRWNDLGILFGFSSIISIVALEFFSPTKLMKVLLYVSTILSLIFVAFINSLIVWSVLALLSLALFVYLFFKKDDVEISSDELPKKKNISFLTLSLLIISILFIIFRSQMGGFISNQFGISQIEARPSLGSTLSIAQNVLTQNPGFGVGPNRFHIEWGLHKPLVVNNTIFWNVNFNYGIGIVPTALVTYGILGFLAWVLFLGMILFLGIKALFSKIEDPVSRFVIVSSFTGVVYLWIFSIISVPNSVIIAITYLATGIFLSSVAREGFIGERVISFSDDSKTGFISVFLLIVFIILSIGVIYMSGSRYLSSVYSQKALAAVNEGDFDSGLSNMGKSLALAKTDSNYRLMSQVHVARLRDILSAGDVQDQETIVRFQEVLGLAISNSQLAAEKDSADHRNWVSLGSIYEAIIPLGIEGAYESARASYERAREANPTNPLINLALARTEVLRGDNQSAREQIVLALQKKNNYTDAIYLLSQIEINEGNVAEAIRAVEAASIINPNNTTTFFQLGFLKFSQGDFQGAIQAFERSIVLTPPYSNAKYFLGLSYYSVGRVEDAILQFEDIEELNPENQEVKVILENLRNGNPPLQSVNTSEDEIVDSLPIQE